MPVEADSAGDVVTENLARLYTSNDIVTSDVPELSRTVTPDGVPSSHKIDQPSSVVEDLYEAADTDESTGRHEGYSGSHRGDICGARWASIATAVSPNAAPTASVGKATS